MAKKKTAKKSEPKAPPLSVAKREELMEQIEAEKAYRAGRGADLPLATEGAVPFVPEEKANRVSEGSNNVEKLQRVLDEGTPEPFKGAERSKAEAEVKELRAWITEKALTQEEMDALPRHGHVYTRAVRKSKMNEVGNPLFTTKATRLKYLERRLWPEDPEAGNIERLRKPR